MQGEFQISYVTWDAVCDEEVPGYEDAQDSPAAEQVAIYAVERLLDGCGPDAFDVDVRDDDGGVHRFTVYRSHGELVCEERVDGGKVDNPPRG